MNCNDYQNIKELNVRRTLPLINYIADDEYTAYICNPLQVYIILIKSV